MDRYEKFIEDDFYLANLIANYDCRTIDMNCDGCVFDIEDNLCLSARLCRLIQAKKRGEKH